MGAIGRVLAFILGEPYSHELPASMRREEIAIGLSNVRCRRRARATSQHELIAHELAVIFTHGSGRRLEAGITEIRASGPLPNISEHLLEAFGGRCSRMIVFRVDEVARHRNRLGRVLPLRFRCESRSCPASISIGLVEADMTDRLLRIDLTSAAKREDRELTVSVALPIQRRIPAE